VTLTPEERLARRRRRRRATAVRWGSFVVAGILLFALGVALGEALHDNPKPGGTISYVRTLHP
jgi:amino acid transporter